MAAFWLDGFEAKEATIGSGCGGRISGDGDVFGDIGENDVAIDF
jgi:hypothetical protein